MAIHRVGFLVLLAAASSASSIEAAPRRLFLNNCVATGGCTVYPGYDDARTQHSSIPVQVSHLTAWSWGDAQWNQLVACVRDVYAPFDIEIVDQDPGTATHDEVIVAGRPSEVQLTGAAGIAPGMCWAVVQESAHVLGLDHELDATDPMTYLGPVKKTGFKDAEVSCGEDLAHPHACACQVVDGGISACWPEPSEAGGCDCTRPTTLAPVACVLLLLARRRRGRTLASRDRRNVAPARVSR